MTFSSYAFFTASSAFSVVLFVTIIANNTKIGCTCRFRDYNGIAFVLQIYECSQ